MRNKSYPYQQCKFKKKTNGIFFKTLNIYDCECFFCLVNCSSGPFLHPDCRGYIWSWWKVYDSAFLLVCFAEADLRGNGCSVEFCLCILAAFQESAINHFSHKVILCSLNRESVEERCRCPVLQDMLLKMFPYAAVDLTAGPHMLFSKEKCSHQRKASSEIAKIKADTKSFKYFEFGNWCY